MSAGFGSPAIDLHEDPRTDAAPGPTGPEVPLRAVTEPAEEQPPVVIGDGLRNWVAAKLAGQPWFAEPQPPIRALVEHARFADWTTSATARSARLVWLYGPAVLARLGAWSMLRVWLRDSAPSVSAEQPPISGVVGRARESGRGPLLWVCAVYVPARICSQIADYAGRTGVALLMAWLLANAAGFPEWVTAAYWWDHATAMWPSGSDSTPPATPAPSVDEPPVSDTGSSAVLSDIGQLVFLAAVVAVFAWAKLRNKNKTE